MVGPPVVAVMAGRYTQGAVLGGGDSAAGPLTRRAVTAHQVNQVSANLRVLRLSTRTQTWLQWPGVFSGSRLERLVELALHDVVVFRSISISCSAVYPWLQNCSRPIAQRSERVFAAAGAKECQVLDIRAKA
ncbi:unnamed protein product [Polarella glacialis]|uniref:Uncharacterized protein n=1 Tax=Polarella glacialis TaxID=89957 RepID=A0A813KMC4_POLGL|nr:unnamed protein product [Polarella glacialis]